MCDPLRIDVRTTRRAVLAGTATVAAAALGLTLRDAGAVVAADVGDDVYDRLRLRWKELALGSGFDPTASPYAQRLAQLGRSADGLFAAMAPDSSGVLWRDLPLAVESSHLTGSCSRLNTMAQAWAQPGTGRTGDAGLGAAVVEGLGACARFVLHPRTRPYGNWWDWRIGSPRLLADTCVIVHDLLTPRQLAACLATVDDLVPDSAVSSYTGTSTGANRTDLCRVLALRGVLGKDPAKLSLARDALSPVFSHVTVGDGLYADGSFIQHGCVPYTGSYGEVQLDGLARLFALLAGSPWEVTDSRKQIVFDAIEHAYAPFLHNGLVMDGVSGRAISRGPFPPDHIRTPQSDHTRGHAIIANIALLAEGADAADKARWQGLVKGWTDRDRHSPVLDDPRLPVADVARLRALHATDVAALPEPVGHRLFPAMDRCVHRRPGWTAALSMASDRIAYYETGNGENLRGWHTGAGMLYWWADGATDGQYSDGFWATVDPYRLPGTTASQKRLANGEGGPWGAARPGVRWVGGTTDGEFAAVGQELRGLSSTMTARKSWFFLDDAVVCLGAGISGKDGTRVETVVDNRDLGEPGDAALLVDGVRQPEHAGRPALIRHARWAHLEGHGGYVFPGGAAVRALRAPRTGNWHAINSGCRLTPVTRRYQTLWFDHGTDPAAAGYAYVLMPGADPDHVATRAADPDALRILANTVVCQAVDVPRLGVTAANFWAPGAVGPLASSGPASVLVRRSSSHVRLCVAAPERTGAPFDVTWHHHVAAVVSRDPGVEVLATGTALTLRVTPGTACVTLTTTVDTIVETSGDQSHRYRSVA